MPDTGAPAPRGILRDERMTYCFGNASYITIKDALRLGLVYWSEADRGWRRMYPDSVRAEQAALEKAAGLPPGGRLKTYVPERPMWQRRRRSR